MTWLICDICGRIEQDPIDLGDACACGGTFNPYTGILYGWSCTLIHDYLEPEGVVWFTEAPRPGQRFRLPSSGYKEEWVVEDVCKYDMSFTAVAPEAMTR